MLKIKDLGKKKMEPLPGSCFCYCYWNFNVFGLCVTNVLPTERIKLQGLA